MPQLSGRPAWFMLCRSSLILPWYRCPCFLAQCTAGTPAPNARSASSCPSFFDACTAPDYGLLAYYQC